MSRIRRPTAVQAYKRTAREAEEKSKTGGTGQTILRMRPGPIAALVDSGEIGQAELQAATEICLAYEELTRDVGFKVPSLERIDGGRRDVPDRADVLDVVRRYKIWVGPWALRKKRGDMTWDIVFFVVILGWALSQVQEKLGLRHDDWVKKVVIAALRHYAALAGWAGNKRESWLHAASESYRLLPIDKRGEKCPTYR